MTSEPDSYSYIDEDKVVFYDWPKVSHTAQVRTRDDRCHRAASISPRTPIAERKRGTLDYILLLVFFAFLGQKETLHQSLRSLLGFRPGHHPLCKTSACKTSA
jgi:hypothetical protein